MASIAGREETIFEGSAAAQPPAVVCKVPDGASVLVSAKAGLVAVYSPAGLLNASGDVIRVYRVGAEPSLVAKYSCDDDEKCAVATAPVAFTPQGALIVASRQCIGFASVPMKSAGKSSSKKNKEPAATNVTWPHSAGHLEEGAAAADAHRGAAPWGHLRIVSVAANHCTAFVRDSDGNLHSVPLVGLESRAKCKVLGRGLRVSGAAAASVVVSDSAKFVVDAPPTGAVRVIRTAVDVKENSKVSNSAKTLCSREAACTHSVPPAISPDDKLVAVPSCGAEHHAFSLFANPHKKNNKFEAVHQPMYLGATADPGEEAKHGDAGGKAPCGLAAIALGNDSVTWCESYDEESADGLSTRPTRFVVRRAQIAFAEGAATLTPAEHPIADFEAFVTGAVHLSHERIMLHSAGNIVAISLVSDETA